MDIRSTILGSSEWAELARREMEVGPEQVLEEIVQKRIWNNGEILWVLKRLIFYYALHDKTLQKAPIDKLFDNVVNLLRGTYMLVDHSNPELDDNIRSYVTAKLLDATWGITQGTRMYLEKVKD